MKKEHLNIEKGSTLKNLKSSPKTQIMLANTNRCLGDYINSIKLRHNGNYNKLPHYLISKKGDVVSILKPNKVSDFFGCNNVDKQIVVILLENLGWLKPKKTKVGLSDWLGKSYIGEVFEKKWRGKLLWAPYTTKQLETLGYLLKEICGDFNISTDFIGHNVKIEGVEKFKGIVTRSNYSEYFKDVSPAFNFDKLKEIL